MRLNFAPADWTQVRRRRDQLLSVCDWTQVPDSPLSPEVKEAWRVYRQKLRDITNTFSNPDEVEWPDLPT